MPGVSVTCRGLTRDYPAGERSLTALASTQVPCSRSRARQGLEMPRLLSLLTHPEESSICAALRRTATCP